MKNKMQFSGAILVIVSTLATGVATAAAASPPKQRLAAYLAAVAKARQPAVAFRPQVVAALTDLTSTNYNLASCSSATSSTLFKNVRLLQVALAAHSKAAIARKLGGANSSFLRPGISAYTSGVYGAINFYTRLGNICLQINSDPNNKSLAVSQLRQMVQQSNQTWREINRQLGIWRQAVVFLAQRLHLGVPAWVYTVGVSNS
jgi:hypothetical protein